MEFLLISLLNGLSFGLLLFMLSSGLTLIFSLMGVLNFAHASFYMLGAYLAYSVSGWWGFWPALLLAPLAVGALGALFEAYCLRPVHRFGHVPELLITFGLSFIVLELVQLVWGGSPVDYRVPEALRGPLFTLYGMQFPAYRGFMMGLSIAVLASLWLGITRTRIGLVIQAALTHPQMVQALGHDVPRIHMAVFAGGAALAALAGAVGGNAFVTEPGMAATVGSVVFVVVVVGGLGSLGGAFAASLLIGLLQTLAVGIDVSLLDAARALGWSPGPQAPGDALWKLKVSQLAPVLPYALMVAVLALRPGGLRGRADD